MIIADTSVWIEFLMKREPIFSVFEEKLSSREIVGIECVFGELLQGCSTEREISIIRSYWHNVPKVNERNVWIDAGEYSGRNNLISKGVGLIDTVILVLAKRAKSSVWTLDKKLLKLLNKELVFRL
ncbi:MAG TPA: PIN domain-containing protein [Thermodesulfobacteriota bacterium]|nr:PIN domain-containing protein [Thermodesulfobacteriota bacterium]